MAKHPIEDLVGSNERHELSPAVNGAQWKQIEIAISADADRPIRCSWQPG